MRWLTIISALTSGGCLAAIQIRHLGFSTSLFDKDARRELLKPLDKADKKLAMVSLLAFLLMLFLILTDNHLP
jgi:uncharacterized protein YqhQ